MLGFDTYEEYLENAMKNERIRQFCESMENEHVVIEYLLFLNRDLSKKEFLEVLEKFADTITYAEAKDIADTFGYVLFSKAKLDKNMMYSDVLAYLKEHNIKIRLRNQR